VVGSGYDGRFVTAGYSPMSASADPIPAIAETEATGEILDIYQDIRSVTGVGVVNLIWRRLAVTEGALPFAWNSVRPVYASGRIAAEGRAFRRQLRPPTLPLLPKSALVAAGVDGFALRNIRAVLDSYDRTNAMNLIGLTALLARLNGASGPGGAAIDSTPEPKLPPIPPLPALDALDPGMRAMVDMLNDFGEEDGQVIASMYRHLAYWPGYLALCWALLAPLAANGSLSKALGAARQMAAAQAASVAPDLASPATDVDAAVVADVQAVLTLFTQHPIAKMVTICRVLASATPAP
jgi:hypothetical protein